MNKKYKPQLLSKTKFSNSDDVIRKIAQHTNHIVIQQKRNLV